MDSSGSHAHHRMTEVELETEGEVKPRWLRQKTGSVGELLMILVCSTNISSSVLQCLSSGVAHGGSPDRL